MVPPLSNIPAMNIQMCMIMVLSQKHMDQFLNWHFLCYTIFAIIVITLMFIRGPRTKKEVENRFEKSKVQLKVGLIGMMICTILQQSASILKLDEEKDMICISLAVFTYFSSMFLAISFISVQSLVLDFEEGYKKNLNTIAVLVVLSLVNILISIPLMQTKMDFVYHLMSCISMGMFAMDLHILAGKDGIGLGTPEPLP